jgi:hypothetical protein
MAKGYVSGLRTSEITARKYCHDMIKKGAVSELSRRAFITIHWVVLIADDAAFHHSNPVKERAPEASVERLPPLARASGFIQVEASALLSSAVFAGTRPCTSRSQP